MPDLTRLHPVALQATVGADAPLAPAPHARRFYVPVRVKYVLVMMASIAWTALSVKLSMRWLHELSQPIGFVPALIIIAFIAYVPGFMMLS